MSTLLIATPTKLALDDVRVLPPARSGITKHRLQNVDANDTMFLLKRDTEPPAGAPGHPIHPGEWYQHPIYLGTGDYKVWVWSNSSNCRFLVSGEFA